MKLDQEAPPIVVEVLEAENYSESHLPSAINVPWGAEFDRQIQERIPDKQQEVVVYCSDRQCAASTKAARAMEHLGYTHVEHFPGGKAEWRAAHLPLEHRAIPRSDIRETRALAVQGLPSFKARGP